MTTDFEYLRGILEHMYSIASDWHDEIISLRREVDDLKAENKNLHDLQTTFDTKFSGLERTLQEKISALNNDISDKNSALVDEVQKVQNNIQGNFQDVPKYLSGLQELLNLQSEVEILKSQRDDLEKERDSLKAEITALEDERDNLISFNDEQENKLRKLRGQIQDNQFGEETQQQEDNQQQEESQPQETIQIPHTEDYSHDTYDDVG